MLFRYKKEFILTYASTFNNNLQLEKIKDFYEHLLKKKNLHYDYIMVKEKEDDQIKRDHYHLWLRTDEVWSCGNKTLDIPLDNPVLVIYEGKVNKSNILGYINSPYIKEEIKDNYEDIENLIKFTFPNHKGEWQFLDKAHPNVQIKKYGCTEYMIDYVTKCIEFSEHYKTASIDELKNKYKKTKTIKQEKEQWPDFESMKEDGMTIESAKQYLIKKYPKWVIKHWNRCEAGFYLLFGNSKIQDFKPDMNATYWIPIGVMTWYNTELLPYILNCDDEEWLSKNRTNRPKSLLWVGPSKIGKTSFIRSIADHNYFYAMLDGLESFNSNLPFSVFDDFPKEWHQFFSNWKPWVGSQTDFVVNPKYGRRRKLLWGHPSVFLANEMPELNKPGKDGYVISKTNEDYINKNFIIVESDKRKLWEEPTEAEKWKYVKINIKDLMYWKLKLKPEIDEENFYMPKASEAIQELIEAEDLRQEMIEKGRPKREVFYVEELPGYEGQTPKRRRTL